MPSASAKLEKQVSLEAMEPLKQVLIFIEHKKRNLEKRKGKLEAYKTEQKNGKDLNGEQTLAVSKYDEVIQSLAFANELVKHIQLLEGDYSKAQKKQQKKEQAKETSDKYQRDMQRTKDVIIIQDVLQSLGNELVKSDFLDGKNGAVCVSKEDMELLEQLTKIIVPKRAFNPSAAGDDVVSGAAQVLVNLLDKKKKEWAMDKTYSDVYDLIMSINSCDYFKNIKNSQKPSPVVQQLEPEEVVVELEDTLVDPAIIKKEISGSPSLKKLPPSPQIAPLPTVEAPMMALASEAPFFVAQQPNTQHFVPPPQQPPVHLPPRQIINEVIGQGNSSFDFLQESQIDAETQPPVMMGQYATPGMVPPTASAVPQPDFNQGIPAAAIPSQTFTNQTFQGMPAGSVPQQQQPPIPVSISPQSNVQPYPPQTAQPVFIEEQQMQQQRPDELKQTVSPASFAQAATYSSLAQQQQKPALQNFTDGPPGFPVQKMHQSQFQPIPTLEQEQESNSWNGDGTGDELGQRGGYRGKGFSRGGRGRGDRNGYSRGPRQNGQGRPAGSYRQEKQEGERSGYTNGTSEQKSFTGTFRRGPPRDGPREPRDGPREPREQREPREWKESREWRDQKEFREPRDNSSGRRGPRPSGQFRGGPSRGRGGVPGGNANPRPQPSQPMKQQQ